MSRTKAVCARGHERTPENVDKNRACKQCQAVNYRNYYQINKKAIAQRQTSHNRKYYYGIDEETFDRMLCAQNGVCPGCNRLLNVKEDSKAVHIDHDHTCCPGRRSCGACVRGILCVNCNRALGAAGDSADTLRRLSVYVRENAVH